MDFNKLPSPSAKRIALRISQPAERALRQGHPWVFDQSITEQSHEGAPGDLAVIFDDKRRFLAIGLYDPTSPIRVRLLQSRDSATINTDWFQNKLASAARLRAPLDETNTTGYRLGTCAEDGLTGRSLSTHTGTPRHKLFNTHPGCTPKLIL